MIEEWVVNGHRMSCAYIRSLDGSNFDGEDPCDCGPADPDGEYFWGKEYEDDDEEFWC